MSTPPWNSARPCSTAQPVQMKDMLQFYAFPESIECATHLDQRLHGIHVQVIAGLIQQQQVGLAERHARHRHSILLATCRSRGGGGGSRGGGSSRGIIERLKRGAEMCPHLSATLVCLQPPVSTFTSTPLPMPPRCVPQLYRSSTTATPDSVYMGCAASSAVMP